MRSVPATLSCSSLKEARYRLGGGWGVVGVVVNLYPMNGPATFKVKHAF